MLRRFWREHPNWRLGQVVTNAARVAGWQMDSVFMLEDSYIWYGMGMITAEEYRLRKEFNAEQTQTPSGSGD